MLLNIFIKFMNLNWHQHIYTFIEIIILIVYLISKFGYNLISPEFDKFLVESTKIYLVLLLLIRFNPFIKVKKITEFQRKVIFRAGLLLIFTINLKNLEYPLKFI